MSTNFSPVPWLIYGANGYTGRLVATEAVRRGHRPVLAGRDPARVLAVASPLDLAHRAFAVDDPAAASRGVDGMALVLNAAGPMAATARPLAEACIAVGAHYVDVTAELDALADVHALDGPARAAGVTLLPAAGYDVVPSDCLAGYVVSQLPQPKHLEIGIWALPQPSRGTLRTVADMLKRGGRRRRAGNLELMRVGGGARRLAFPPGRRWSLPVPWGDLITAYRSTGVPNITTYLALKPTDFALGLVIGPLGPWLFRVPLAARAFERALSKGAEGPSAALRDSGRGWFWAKATDASGTTSEAWLETPEGYRFTALAAIEVVERILGGDAPVGVTTPAGAFGFDFVLSIPGCARFGDVAVGPLFSAE